VNKDQLRLVRTEECIDYHDIIIFLRNDTKLPKIYETTIGAENIGTMTSAVQKLFRQITKLRHILYQLLIIYVKETYIRLTLIIRLIL
jgi:hypothetical protein